MDEENMKKHFPSKKEIEGNVNMSHIRREYARDILQKRKKNAKTNRSYRKNQNRHTIKFKGTV